MKYNIFLFYLILVWNTLLLFPLQNFEYHIFLWLSIKQNNIHDFHFTLYLLLFYAHVNVFLH